MKQLRVEFHEDTRNDPKALYDWIAESSGRETALAYLKRLEDYCCGLDIAPKRGRLRDDIRPGLRIVGFERRVTVAFIVEEDRVVILRLFYGGRNWKESFEE